jgi:hypothetical protein
MFSIQSEVASMNDLANKSLLAKLAIFQNWKYYGNNGLVTPFTFKPDVAKSTAEIAFFDDRSFIKGITVFSASCQNVTTTSALIVPTAILQSPHVRPPNGPWRLDLLDSNTMTLTRPEGVFTLKLT